MKGFLGNCDLGLCVDVPREVALGANFYIELETPEWGMVCDDAQAIPSLRKNLKTCAFSSCACGKD